MIRFINIRLLQLFRIFWSITQSIVWVLLRRMKSKQILLDLNQLFH
jgi:hypothetical protein